MEKWKNYLQRKSRVCVWWSGALEIYFTESSFIFRFSNKKDIAEIVLEGSAVKPVPITAIDAHSSLPSRLRNKNKCPGLYSGAGPWHSTDPPSSRSHTTLRPPALAARVRSPSSQRPRPFTRPHRPPSPPACCRIRWRRPHVGPRWVWRYGCAWRPAPRSRRGSGGRGRPRRKTFGTTTTRTWLGCWSSGRCGAGLEARAGVSAFGRRSGRLCPGTAAAWRGGRAGRECRRPRVRRSRLGLPERSSCVRGSCGEEGRLRGPAVSCAVTWSGAGFSF